MEQFEKGTFEIPNKVKVAGVEYTVNVKPYIDISGDRNYQGVCNYQHTTIELLDDLSEERKRDTFFHELTHAIFYEAGFEDQDEDEVNRVAKVIHQVITDNKF